MHLASQLAKSFRILLIRVSVYRAGEMWLPSQSTKPYTQLYHDSEYTVIIILNIIKSSVAV